MEGESQQIKLSLHQTITKLANGKLYYASILLVMDNVKSR